MYTLKKRAELFLLKNNRQIHAPIVKLNFQQKEIVKDILKHVLKIQIMYKELP